MMNVLEKHFCYGNLRFWKSKTDRRTFFEKQRKNGKK